jgi:hypothetical protein
VTVIAVKTYVPYTAFGFGSLSTKRKIIIEKRIPKILSLAVFNESAIEIQYIARDRTISLFVFGSLFK